MKNFKPLNIFFAIIFALPLLVSAQSVSELKQNIEDHNNKIKQLEEEIKIYEKEIETTSGQAQSLQNTIKILDTNQKKLGTEIKKTETSIQKTNLTIEQLNDEIKSIEESVALNTAAISKSLNELYRNDDQTLIESFLAGESLSDVLDEFQIISGLQSKIRAKTRELENYKSQITGKKTQTENKKGELVSLKSNLNDQNQILNINKKEKNNLLVATKNKETEYKSVLTQKQAEKERFEQELYEYESKLKKAIDPNSFPSSGKGILSWPLDSVFVTQFFGTTVDSKRLYKSGTHNGLDFRASIGTPVKTVIKGTVQGIGNTDEQKGCYSYGKWVLIKHANGLSTLYGHLSLIKVSAGQEVRTGDVIGYSGNTGYSTGPHLHLTVYASDGIIGIQKYSSSIGCKNVSIPIADVNAYLDPMLYLPAL